MDFLANIDISFWLFKILEILRYILDFSLIAVSLYGILYYLRGARAANILVGISILLLGATAFAFLINLEVCLWLLQNIWQVFVVIVVVVFQPELRRALAQLGTSKFIAPKKREQSEAIEEVVKGVVQMSRRHCGALIIFECKIGMAYIAGSAVAMDCKLNSLLLQSLFFPNSPLHDGALLVKDGKIIAAHVILPLAHDMPSNQNLGTRHRAAIGITEETDAVAIVVSEETGSISVAYNGKLIRNPGETDILVFLRNHLMGSSRKDRLSQLFEQPMPSRCMTLQRETEALHRKESVK